MFDPRKYWAEIRAIEDALPAFLWIVDAAGTLVEVTARIGAKLLHAKSHRVATEGEVRAYCESVWAARSEAERKSKEDGGVAVVPVGD